jgi:hypothetical protein
MNEYPMVDKYQTNDFHRCTPIKAKRHSKLAIAEKTTPFPRLLIALLRFPKKYKENTDEAPSRDQVRGRLCVCFALLSAVCFGPTGRI